MDSLRPAAPLRDAVLPALAMFAGLLAAAHPLLRDPDTLWQIRAGQWILQHAAVPRVDPFSFTMAGQPWPPHQWLGQLLLALAYDGGSWSGVTALAAACGAGAFGLLVWHLGRFLRPLPALLAAVLGFSLVFPTMLARPHQIALPCLELWTAGLVWARARNRAPPAWLAAVMALWANLHGGFLAGLALGAALAAEAVWQGASGRGRVARGWAAFLALSVLAACLTPQGPAGLLFPLHLTGMPALAFIPEWQPSRVSDLLPLEMAILLALYLGLTGRVRLPPWRVLLVLAPLGETFAHVRYLQLLGILSPLLLAPACADAMARARTRVSPVGTMLAAVAGLAALLGRLALPAAAPPTATAALAAVPACLAARPVLNAYRFGGALIFAGIAPFVDGRAELYGSDFLDRYGRIDAGDPAEIDRTLRQWDIAWALLDPGSLILATLERRPGWRRLHADEEAVVMVRDGAANCAEGTPP